MTPVVAHSGRRRAGTNELGAVLVQMAFAMTVLCGFGALAVDYGVLMAARGQAQAAADAGALAGATAMGFDYFGSTVIDSRTVSAAQAVAAANLVLGAAPALANTDVRGTATTIEGFPPSPDPERTWTGVRVSAFRMRVPTFFGRLVGIDGQDVGASATATVVPSNASDCVWPLAIPDNWYDEDGNGTFVKYAATGPPTLATPVDIYLPPRFTPPDVLPDTGYSMPVSLEIDVSLTLTPANFGLDALGVPVPIGHGQFVAVNVPRSGGGGFVASLSSCNGMPVTIGDVLPVDGAGAPASARSAAAALVAADPTASWNPGTFRVQSSCASDPAPCAAMSPRVIVLPVFDLNRYEETRWTAGVPGATPQIEIVNFVGFFITQVTASEIRGQLTLAPGRVITGRPMVGYESAFLRTAVLTR